MGERIEIRAVEQQGRRRHARGERGGSASLARRACARVPWGKVTLSCGHFLREVGCGHGSWLSRGNSTLFRLAARRSPLAAVSAWRYGPTVLRSTLFRCTHCGLGRPRIAPFAPSVQVLTIGGDLFGILLEVPFRPLDQRLFAFD